MLITLAEAADISNIHRLLYDLADATGETASYAGDVKALSKYSFGAQKLFHVLLARNEQAAVGLCTFFPVFSTWHCRPGLYVQDLYVDDDYRRNGLGRRLLCNAAHHAEMQWQASFLQLSVVKSNSAGKEFYHALGFTNDDTYDRLLLSDDSFYQLKSEIPPV